VIVGAGPAGAIAALVLAKAGHNILLISHLSPDIYRMSEVLVPSASRIMRNLGLLERFLDDRPLPCYGNLFAWGSDELRSNNCIYDPDGHGWHINRSRFDTILQNAASDAGSYLRRNVRVIKTQRFRDIWQMILRTEKGFQSIYSRLIIDATGRRCSVAQNHGAIRIRDDNLVALFSRFGSRSGDNDTRTMIEAVPYGWWFSTLDRPGERTVAFLTDADLIDHSIVSSREFESNVLNQTCHIRDILKTYCYTIQDHVYGRDAGSTHLNHYAGHGWLATGDAAISFDPLSSQGVLNAMYTGMKAGQAVDAHLLGQSTALHNYSNQIHKIYSAYRQNYTTYYRYEVRWPDQTFWKRRSEQELGRL
jgi:flavin-dependent dehydrogenase